MTVVVMPLDPAIGAEISVRGSQLPYDARTATCEVVLSFVDHDANAKLNAAFTYLNGRTYSQKCFSPNYVRAFELFKAVGATRAMKWHLKDLQQKAEAGNAFAIGQLSKLEQTGLTKLAP